MRLGSLIKSSIMMIFGIYNSKKLKETGNRDLLQYEAHVYAQKREIPSELPFFITIAYYLINTHPNS